MKKFRFPLKSLASVREARELQAREAFSVAAQAYSEAEQKLIQVRLRLKELARVMLESRGHHFQAAEQVSFLQVHRQEQLRETEAVAALEQARQTMETRRREWLERRRDLRLIEKLEEKARLTHRRAAERELQAELDDRTNALAVQTSLLAS